MHPVLGFLQSHRNPLPLSSQNLRRRPKRREAPFAQQQYLGSRRQRVGRVMRSHHRLHPILAQPQLQSLQQCIAGHAVERRERFVEQQQPWRRRQRARQRHALRFTSRQILWATLSDIGCAAKRQHLFDTRRASCGVDAAQTVCHILSNAQVREERGLLRHQRGAPTAGRKMQSGGGVSERARIMRDAAARWTIEPREQTQQSALA